MILLLFLVFFISETHPQTAYCPTPSRNQKLGLKRKKERMKGIFIVQLLQSQVLQMPSYPTPCFLTLNSPISCSPKPKTLDWKHRRKEGNERDFHCPIAPIPSYPTPYSPNPRLSNPMFSKPQVIQPHVVKPRVSKP